MAYILLLNLLIAMMGDTYTRIAEIKNEWMRQASLKVSLPRSCCKDLKISISLVSDKSNYFSVGHDGADSGATDTPQDSAQGAGHVLGEDGHGREGACHEADNVGKQEGWQTDLSVTHYRVSRTASLTPVNLSRRKNWRRYRT